MILKKQVYQPDKRANPIIGVLLFLISIVLLAVTAPFGFVYGIFESLFTKGFRGIGEYLLKVAISIDQLGNVLMQHLLNVLWVKDGGYKFGNRDETISSALGRNRKLGTLTVFGRGIDKFLDYIDPDHTLNSIDYYIEPSEEIVELIAWIHIEGGQILSTKSTGKDLYYIPSGARIPEVSDSQALYSVIKEKLDVELDLPAIHYTGIFEAQADNQDPGILIRMTCYSGSYTGRLLPKTEIAEIVWLNYGNRDMVPPVDQLIFDFLKEKGELV